MAKNVNAALDGILNKLNEKQREIVVNRFGLDLREPQTLAALGERFRITRERVRQIEGSALKIISENIKANSDLLDVLYQSQELLRKFGGVAHEEDFLREHKSSISNLDKAQINLLIEALPYFYFYEGDEDFHNFYYLTTENLKSALDLVKKAENYLSKNKNKIMATKEALKDLSNNLKLEEKILSAYIKVSKKFHTSPFGDFGLRGWPEIKPATIRDKAYLILKKKGEPMHFRAITDAINVTSFDKRKALSPTVHNELIKDKRFVLVGRGIYGLREQGYEEGTAREVIASILKSKGPMKSKDIIDAVQKKRFFKPNTILINLQNKKYFKRTTDGKYSIK
ncbi:MAG: HTH domain-containing protein [Patescibacteria group bacterium]|nr:HTH domain-containing protein [Patescibacteria group bacterium]